MDVLRLPYGPWYPLFGGKYEGTDVSLYQNPDRDFLSVIVDRDEKGNPRGLVLTMYKGFLAEGPVQQLLESMKQNAYLFITKRGGNIHRFLLIVRGPRYIGIAPEELRKAIEEMGNALYREQIVVRELAKAMSVTLTALRDVPKRVAAALLAEPLVLPRLTGTKTTVQIVEEAPQVVLGKNRDGLVAKEPIKEFRCVCISGEHERGRKKALAIFVENYALAGIPVILFSKNPRRYEGLRNAGTEKLKEYHMAPMGFPVSIVSPGNGAFIDLNVIDPDAFLDLLGVSPNAAVARVFREALGRGKGGLETIKDLHKYLTGSQYFPLQARRIILAAEKKFGNVFGKNEATNYLTATELGGITVVSMREDVVHMALAHTILEVVYLFLKKRGRRGGVAVVFEDAHRLVPRARSPLVNALIESVKHLADIKAYLAFETPNESQLPDDIMRKIETRVVTVSDDEAGMRILTKRPYRFFFRPFASSITI